MNLKTLIIILISINCLFACEEKQKVTGEKKTTVLVETRSITRQNVIRIHDIPAVFIAMNRAKLAFQLSGRIDKVLVKIGEKVEKNQVLMSLYNPNLNPAIASNFANLESIKANIKQTISDVANLKELRKNNSASRNALEHKETELKDLYAKKKSIGAQIQLSQANQQESFIRAPFESTVVAVEKQLGEFISAGQIAVVVNQSKDLEVEVNISSLLWKSLALDDKLTGTYDSQKIEFKVVEIAQMADSRSHLYKVVLQLTSTIKNAIGQQVVIHLGQTYNNVYKLPLESVVDDGINKPYIFSQVDGKAQKAYIQPLFIDGNDIVFYAKHEINGEVVIKGQSRISSDMELKSE